MNVSNAKMRNAANICAILDCASVLGYFLGVEPTYFQFIAVILKIFSIFYYLELFPLSFLRVGRVNIIVFCIAPIFGIFANFQYFFDEVVRPASFLINFICTLMLLSPYNFEYYLKSVSNIVLAFNVLYLAEVAVGRIDNSYGRYLYFNEFHPNLGSEISAIGGVAANLIIANRMRLFLSAPFFLAPIILMQGRAALLAYGLSFLARVGIEAWHFARRGLGNLIVTYSVGSLLLMVLAPFVYRIVYSLLLIDDEYRGGSTGFVGRDERWAGALNAFYESPFLGNGLYFFERLHIDSSHNFYLYALSGYGIFSLLFFFALFSLCFKFYFTNKREFIIFIPIFILTVFNDRFLNLNLYPYLFYIMIFGFGLHEYAKFFGGPMHRSVIGARSSNP